MEEMEEDALERIEDDNHNCRAEGVSVSSPAQVCVDSDSSSDTCESDSSATSAANGAALLFSSTSKFCKLHRGAGMWHTHSELLYNDLMWKITSHLEQVSSELQASPPELLIENFNVALTQYTAALHCIVPVFIYMNKFYIETKLNRDLRDDLMKLFSDHVAEKHVSTLLPLLKKAHSMPFQVKPSTMASVVKGLYALRPDWVPLAPALFSRFIPQIHPPALESQLPYYAAQDKKLQLELSQNGFTRGDQSRKRASEES
uniref:CDK2 associated cullin domain 1 n=1 Tax=Cyprinus carpio carpio TaxID=630221 RepID=A0A9J8BRG7_CYPCA